MTIATKGKGNPEGLAGDKYFISLIEHAADGIAILQDGVFKMVNTALARMSGYDKKELLGMPFTHLLTPQSQKLTIERYQARLAGKKVRPVYEIKAISKDGKIRDIEINAALTEYEGRVADEIIVRDVTERKQVEHNLQERMKELGGLYRIASIAERPGITLDEINQETVKLLPQGWQYPEVACAQLTIDGKEFRTANYRETEWKQFADIKVHGIKAGMVVVGYLEERPASDEGPFLKEERSLIDAVAERLGQITDRKQAEEALADEVTRRRILIDQSRDGIVVLDENGKVYEANQQFAEMLGYTPEEATQLHVWDWEFVFPREQVLEMIRSVDAAGDHFETQHRRKDGTTIDVEISTNGAICAGQKLIFCVCRDITERKQAEEELKLRAQILDGATDIIQVHDASDNFVYVNEAACIAYGYSREELMKMKLTQIVAPERLRPLASDRQELLETGHIIVESAHMRKDGSVFPVEVHARTIESGGGKLFLTVARDITERKQVEEALKAEKNKLQSLIDAIEDGLNIRDKDFNIIYQNEPVRRLYGDRIGEKCYRVYEGRDRVCDGCP
ncbi:MAG: PAS domain S-box protein, partial [Deltaproteobacteria bacterium]|nr:PAS domain S-box protein [Deltaproteobacteria bacterium]